MFQLEEVMVVSVKTEGYTPNSFRGEDGSGVVMIPFEATVSGKYFNGTVLPGGVDTQVIGPGGKPHTLSARYMAKGTDYTGEECFVYIENNGVSHFSPENGFYMKTHPKFVTNSKALSFLNTDIFVGDSEPLPGGVKIILYRVKNG